MLHPASDSVLEGLSCMSALLWYRFVAVHQLVGSDGLVQAWFAHVDVAVLGETRQQRQQRLRVQVVVVVHVTKPPAGGEITW